MIIIIIIIIIIIRKHPPECNLVKSQKRQTLFLQTTKDSKSDSPSK